VSRLAPGPRRWRGELVCLPVGRGRRRLDGFFAPASRPEAAAVYVHGMFSNFYRSELKKAMLSHLPAAGVSLLSVNTRGAERGTLDEPFGACLADLDAALEFIRRTGGRRLGLIGHSTGCQKSLHYLDRRRPPDVRAFVALAPADDRAILRRELGRRWARALAQARAMAAGGRGGEPVPGLPHLFTARRFLSLADERSIEASLFDYEGPMRAWRRLGTPTLVLFGDREEYAVRPVRWMLRRLAALRPGATWTRTVRGADHGFHGREREVAVEVARWLAARLVADGRRR